MVDGKRIGNLAAAIRAGHFEIISGVRPEKGGADEGPDPHELVEAALAACTIITIQMYANRKGWPLEDTKVSIKIESETPAGAVFVRDIAFTGPLTEDQRSRLFEIANKCPIHLLLERKIEIRSNLQAT